jgi:RNA recognition motif-containing protein
MSSKLYVSGLPYSGTERQLEEIFSKHGSVLSAHVISDKFSGKSRSFGFVDGLIRRSQEGHRGPEWHGPRRPNPRCQ